TYHNPAGDAQTGPPGRPTARGRKVPGVQGAPADAPGRPAMTRLERQRFATGLAFLSPWMAGFLAFTLGPIVLAFYYSLCDYSLLQSPAYIGVSNYRALMGDPVFWKSLKVTL